MKTMSVLLLLVASAALAAQVQKPIFQSVEAAKDVKLTLDPTDPFWDAARPVYLQVGTRGQSEMNYRTEVRSRWAKDAIYFLFSCPYKQLSVKPNPDTSKETYELWNWNVAEVFLGSDFKDIKRYKEFEVSPQNEWIDLDVDLHKPHHEEGWVWNSGFEVSARIDHAAHVWYGAMRIPYSAIDTRPPAPGNSLRV